MFFERLPDLLDLLPIGPGVGWSRQFGYSRDELLGQQVTNIIPEGFAERLIADDLRSAEDALEQQIGTGIELTARRKDGTDFPIELMLSPLASGDTTTYCTARSR